MTSHPGRALYSIARYWRSMGIQQLALTLPAEELPSPETIAKEKQTHFDTLVPQVESCQKCGLFKNRKQAILGSGNIQSPIVFISGPPDEQSDQDHEPLKGEVGELFDKMIEKMGFKREHLYITNIVKCRPLEDRHATNEELTECHSWLEKQLELISPPIIITLGSVATKALLKLEAPITQLRGNFHQWKDAFVMPTYHPAYLLKKNTAKREVWNDMLAVLEKLNSLNVKSYATAEN